MANDDEAGARAAADYFLALYGYTYQAGDFTLLDTFCHDESTFCAGVRDQLAAQVEGGERYFGGTVTWTSEPTVERQSDSSMYILTGDVSQAPLEVLGADGTTIVSTDTTTRHSGVAVFFDAGEWTGFDIDVDRPSDVS